MIATKYPLLWRYLHWLIAALVFVMLPIGFWMMRRGDANIWDTLTNVLYSTHKSIGFLIIWLMLARLIFKLTVSAPSYPPQMPALIRKFAHGTHYLMYLLLFAIPLIGWAGVTAYPALNIAWGISLPALPLIPESESLAKYLFNIHGWLAIAFCFLIAAHIAGALKHKYIDKDGVFDRMSLKK